MRAARIVLLSVVVALLAIGVSGAPPAEALTVSYFIDCVINGAGCTSVAPFNVGTITFTDVAGGDGFSDVQVTVDLGGLFDAVPGDERIQKVFLNYNDGVFADGTTFDLTGGVVGTATSNEDEVKPDGYPCCSPPGDFGGLDLEIPEQGNAAAFDTLTFVISLANFNLNITHFDQLNELDANGGLDASDLVRAAFHIGSIGEGEESIFVGAQTPVPEPGTLLLLGSGLVGAGAWGRKRLLKRRES